MKHTSLIISFIASLWLAACSNDVPIVNLGIDDFYRISRMQKLSLTPAFTGEAYRWYVDGRLVATSRDYVFVTGRQGTYHLTFEVIDPENPYRYDFTVEVTEEQEGYSPYISRVYEYCPAPGQFVNEMPRYEDGDTYEDMLRKVEDAISDTNDIMITLGSFGGYVTFGFDHTVINVKGEKDIRIWGNAIYADRDLLNPGGSAEPGIVMVSYDANCNGLPDDPWYELAGSEYSNPATKHSYSVTYHRPDPLREIIAGAGGQISDLYYIACVDSEDVTSYLPKNVFHTQDYFPKWSATPALTFTGTCLPPNAEDISDGVGENYILHSYSWGYADNHPNSEADLCSFDIDWAVDSEGRPVHLDGIDFVRVYTGLNQYCGWIGESSTEICRAADLHLAPE